MTEDEADGDQRLVLHRAMQTDADGLPLVGDSARTLGVRSPGDIESPDGVVAPGTGGLSVSPGTAMNLPRHRRPSDFDGSGRDPVWALSADLLPDGLRYAEDSDVHGTIEPGEPMELGDFRSLLAGTRSLWQQVIADED